VQESIDKGASSRRPGPRASRNRLQTTTLLDAIEEHGFDAAIGGARRDEERSRAKERIFSFRTTSASGTRACNGPSCGTSTTRASARASTSASSRSRTGPSSTVWQYVAREQLELPPIYFAHEREVFRRDGMLYAVSPYVERMEGRSRSRRRSASAPSAT
jgi:3''-phosphoadenosine 5''-phosphosulfate sulfotransferase (PAPS reductase)/FAD synthetase and related enzymes